MYFTGHTDAFNTVANVILGINSGLPAVGVNFPNGGNYANLIILETTILLYHVFSGNVIPIRYWFLPHILVIKLIYYILLINIDLLAFI
jgi:hypothetical protein